MGHHSEIAQQHTQHSAQPRAPSAASAPLASCICRHPAPASPLAVGPRPTLAAVSALLSLLPSALLANVLLDARAGAEHHSTGHVREARTRARARHMAKDMVWN